MKNRRALALGLVCACGIVAAGCANAATPAAVAKRAKTTTPVPSAWQRSVVAAGGATYWLLARAGQACTGQMPYLILRSQTVGNTWNPILKGPSACYNQLLADRAPYGPPGYPLAIAPYERQAAFLIIFNPTTARLQVDVLEAAARSVHMVASLAGVYKSAAILKESYGSWLVRVTKLGGGAATYVLHRQRPHGWTLATRSPRT